MIGIAASAASVLVAWSALDLGRPAWHPFDIQDLRVEIGEVADLAIGNARLLRKLEWFRLQEKIDNLEYDLAISENPELASRLRSQIFDLKREQMHLDNSISITPPLTDR